jgi:hypothetical protein
MCRKALSPELELDFITWFAFGQREWRNSGEVDDELRVEDVNEFEDDFVGDDDASHNDYVDDQDDSESEEEEYQADHSVFNLYEKMFNL